MLPTPDARSPAAGETHTLTVLRRFLLATLIAGAVGTGVELLLIGHYEDRTQLVPLVLLGATAAAGVWHAIAPRPHTVRLLQAVMLASLAAGAVGIGLHYAGNEEFELEMYPTLAGRELFAKTMTGATPVLAPGTLALVGLIGLAATYRHPQVRGRSRED